MLLIVLELSIPQVAALQVLHECDYGLRHIPYDGSQSSSLNTSTQRFLPRNVLGNQRTLVILVEFADIKHSYSESDISQLVFVNMRGYWEEVSYGKISVTGKTLGWYTLGNAMSHYGGDSKHAIDDPSGEGWYDAGANAYATLEVSKVSADFLNDYVFKGWKGDARGSQPKSSAIKMDGPRTAEAIWEKQFSMNMYIIIAVAVAVPVAAVAWLKLKPSAKKREIKAPALVSPSSITCPQCGSSNTPDNSFCASCGKPLRPPGK